MVCAASALEKQQPLEVERHKLECGCGCGSALSLQPPLSPSTLHYFLVGVLLPLLLLKNLYSVSYTMLTVQPEELLLLAKALESAPTALLSGLEDFQNRLHQE